MKNKIIEIIIWSICTLIWVFLAVMQIKSDDLAVGILNFGVAALCLVNVIIRLVRYNKK